nr:stalk domain-containing protein [Paenibacillus sp. DMB20]
MNFKKMSIVTVLAVAQVSTIVPVSAQSSAALEPGSAQVQPGENSGTSELQQPLDTQTVDNTGSSIGTNSALTQEDAGVPVEAPGNGQNGASSAEDPSSGQQSNSVESSKTTESGPTSEESVAPNDQAGGNEENTGENAKAEGESESVSTEPAGDSDEAATSNSNVLVLMMNSANMYHNGEHFKAAQPMAVKNGVSYVSIRAMVERAGLKLTYDFKTKETIIHKGENELRFKTDSNKYKVNGESRTMKGPAYQYKNTFMVPLTSITQALGIPYQVNQAEKKVILDLSGLESDGGSTSAGGTNGSDSGGTGSVQPPASNEPGLVLIMNSAKMYHNGKLYTAAQPMAVKNGVSYVAIRSLVNRVGLKLTYDSRTKETVIQRGGDELRFKTDSKIYTVNGVKTAMKGPAYQYKDTFMVPLTSLTQALKIPYRVDQANKRIILQLSTKPIASFRVVNKEIFAGQTTVTYKTSAYSPAGLPIVDERWEGREDVFHDPGTHTVTYYVQDSSGEWSDPYSVNVEVLTPNEPPVAMFSTDKEEYKMGEKITYIDQSSDDENAIVDWDWDNNAMLSLRRDPPRSA